MTNVGPLAGVTSTSSRGRAQKAIIWTLFSPQYTQILQQQCDKYYKKTTTTTTKTWEDMVRQGDKPVTQIMEKMKKSLHLCCEVKEEGGARQGEPAGFKNSNKLTFLRKSASFQFQLRGDTEMPSKEEPTESRAEHQNTLFRYNLKLIESSSCSESSSLPSLIGGCGDSCSSGLFCQSPVGAH